MKSFENKSVAVTGCCGTVGGELVRQLLEDYKVGELVGLDNNETEMFFLQQRHKNYPNANFFLSSIRDRERLIELFKGVDIVFHAAAYKHVVLCEHSPFDAVQTNIIGVKNVIEAAKECSVERVIFTSSDKAVNPTNVMGTTKLMGERLMTAANCARKGEGPIYSSTRFGNVLGSRGSVIPIFREQIRKGGPVTLTDRNMTRFIMSIKEATNLVIDSSSYAWGGEIFVTKMPVIRIEDLAQVMIMELAPYYGHKPDDIEINTIGTKPGEKLYEELMSDEETGRTQELEKYFAVLPSYRSLYREINYEYPGVVSNKVDNPYHSANERSLSQVELNDFLLHNELLAESMPQQHPAERFWDK
ncbi:polysaccharide biosynthesis protein [Accumulibacter sp.]|uniref:polysaccharide biosynthesis protein n=1 Tax=Accumulibacter sp. TaxID=2053492 RepID=UPI00263A1017|nr:polysaccharide biosynthesis protein [Accumulibacter sp.]